MANPITSLPFTFAPFGFITGATPNVPEFYWNVVSDEQRWKFLCVNLAELADYANTFGAQIDENTTDIASLNDEFEKFKESGFVDYYEEQIQAWIDANMAALISESIKQVYFGLDDDGYFVAYIPDSWNEITFDTGAVYGRSDYGRLILKFSADNAIDNTYSYSLAQTTTLQQLIADLETDAKRTDASYDALFTNIDTEVSTSGNL